MNMKTFLAFFIPVIFFISLIIEPAEANTVFLKKSNIDEKQYATAKIMFEGEVNTENMMALITSLDEINLSYPSVKKIKLYINSEGGAVESGYSAYEAIKSSRIPVTTINLGQVSSAATLLYCGGKERLVFPSAFFLLHAPYTTNNYGEDLKLNHIELLKNSVMQAADMLREVYEHCTSLQKEELDQLFFSEDFSISMKYDKAIKYGMATGKASSIAPADVGYYITRKNNE